MKKLVLCILALTYLSTATIGRTERLVWPPTPDQARIEALGEIRCDQLTPKTGFFGKLARMIGGRSQDEDLSLPFDVLAVGDQLFAVCQNLPALVEIDLTNSTFRLHSSTEHPFVYPLSLCDGEDGIVFVTDPEIAAVFRYDGNKVTRLISENLVRPTGIAALPNEKRLYVVDTGDHTLKIFSYDGDLIRIVPDENDSVSLHYPTFAAATNDGCILVNDALNYRIRRYNADGDLLASFGHEGDSPGSFARPKGVSVDSDGHLYVVDNLFDNIQVFDPEGRLMLVVGASGQDAGQFWSPAGIDIAGDTIYVADTHNNRIQILHYLGAD